MIEVLLFILVLLSVALMGHYFYQRMESNNQKMCSIMALVSTMANEMQLMRTKVNMLDLQNINTSQYDSDHHPTIHFHTEENLLETSFSENNSDQKHKEKEEEGKETSFVICEYKLIEVSDDEDDEENDFHDDEVDDVDDDDDNHHAAHGVEDDCDEAIDTDEKLGRTQSMHTQQHLLDFLQTEMFRTFHPVSCGEGIGFSDVGIMSFGMQVSNNSFGMQNAEDMVVSDLINALSFVDGSETMHTEEPLCIHEEEDAGFEDLTQSFEVLDSEEQECEQDRIQLLEDQNKDQIIDHEQQQEHHHPQQHAWSFIDEESPVGLSSVSESESTKFIHVGESEDININQMKKLTLPKLRDLAKSKGLVDDSSNKLKKTELLKLFGI